MPSRFEADNGNDFLNQVFKPPVPLAEGWVNEGDAVLITSQTGGGKTRFTLNYALHSSLGKDFGNLKINQPISSYFLDSEMRPNQMQIKVKKFLPLFEQHDLSKFYYKNLCLDDGIVNFCDEATQDEFIFELKELGVNQVFLDNFFTLFHVQKYNDPNEFLAFVLRFIKKFREAEITSWWIDHNNKAGGVFGSIAKQIYFDYILKIHHEREDDVFDLEVLKEREVLDINSLSYQFNESGHVEGLNSKKVGVGSSTHFWSWCEDFIAEARDKCNGNKTDMAHWLVKGYANCHEEVSIQDLPNADWVRRKI